MSAHADHTALRTSLRELFPELCGAPIDLERHAASVIVRALNDGSESLQEGVIRYYGLDRVRQVAAERTDRLTNPAYRAWRERLELPAGDPRVAYAHSLWRR
ncbi:MAG TPA: hypothetical protein VJT67_13685 [Longimicrobiaceae bacterium]|nr:hypothetical protein [Longimicrobiaceae bacterium]